MPQCPVCRTEMRQMRRGATLVKRGPSYVCPNNEAEIVIDDLGRRSLKPGALHPRGLRSWSPDELEEVAPCPA